MPLLDGLCMHRNKWAEGMKEWGKGNLDRTRRVDLNAVKNCYNCIEGGRGSDDGSDTVPQDAVPFGERE